MFLNKNNIFYKTPICRMAKIIFNEYKRDPLETVLAWLWSTEVSGCSGLLYSSRADNQRKRSAIPTITIIIIIVKLMIIIIVITLHNFELSRRRLRELTELLNNLMLYKITKPPNEDNHKQSQTVVSPILYRYASVIRSWKFAILFFSYIGF